MAHSPRKSVTPLSLNISAKDDLVRIPSDDQAAAGQLLLYLPCTDHQADADVFRQGPSWAEHTG
jgi:hypothetical protein